MDARGKEFLGQGWAFPPNASPTTGRTVMAAYEEDVRQAICIILETSKGERVMRPEFGCGIHDLVFDVLSSTTLRRVEREVDEALRQFEARIEVEGVRVNPNAIELGRLDVAIDYRVRATNQPGNLVYPFYFKEGG
jgi:phage baseplate assembly protein W